ncbi:MAG TPA: hypothetical protein VFJ74_16330 [Gemmatimonadaceae bacterium]|nr:hypothetical protein [Gemmatimonadaceae bacterium]
MLTQDDLARLAQSLSGARVLSVYVDLTARDPAQKQAWRTRLDDGLRRIRDGIAADRQDERAALSRAVDHMEARLASDLDAGGARSWVAFATERQVHHAETLPVHAPGVVAWGEGPRVAPYLRLLRARRAVILAEVNAEGARLYRYFDGNLESLEHLRAHVATDSHDHMGSMPRQGFHTGTRGATGTDAAQRELRAGTRRMLHELARRLVTLAGADSWIVIGGTPVPAKAALAALPDALASRTLLTPALHVWASEAQIRDAAARGAAALEDAHDLASVSAAVERAARAGRGATGIDATLGALATGAVEDLYVSDRFLERSPREAEDAVRAALGHGARPRIVCGDAAGLLNDTAQGIAARLRYTSVVS